MRAAGTVLFLIAGGLCGFWAAARLKKRVTVLAAIRLWIRCMETEFRFHAAPLTEMLAECREQPALRELTFLKAAGGSGAPPQQLSDAVKREKRALALNEEDTALLLRLIDGLGRTDLLGQQAHLADCAERFEEQEAQARDAYLRQGKVCRVAGICTAAALALVLW